MVPRAKGQKSKHQKGRFGAVCVYAGNTLSQKEKRWFKYATSILAKGRRRLQAQRVLGVQGPKAQKIPSRIWKVTSLTRNLDGQEKQEKESVWWLSECAGNCNTSQAHCDSEQVVRARLELPRAAASKKAALPTLPYPYHTHPTPSKTFKQTHQYSFFSKRSLKNGHLGKPQYKNL